MIREVKGNILNAKEDILVQQVNCKGLMGKGLAAMIMVRYATVKREYQTYRLRRLREGLEEQGLLGEVNYVLVRDGKIIANVFGQIDIRKGRWDKTIYTKEQSLLDGIKKVKEYAQKEGKSVAIPTNIGSGLGGGNWDTIKKGIEDIFNDGTVPIQFYTYSP